MECFPFCKKGVLKNFGKSSGRFNMKKFQKQPLEVFCKKKLFLKTLQNSLENTCARVSFFIKLQGETCNFIKKKRLWHRCFPVNYAKFLNKNIFLQDTSGRLLLKFSGISRSPYFTEHLLCLVSVFNDQRHFQWRSAFVIKVKF